MARRADPERITAAWRAAIRNTLTARHDASRRGGLVARVGASVDATGVSHDRRLLDRRLGVDRRATFVLSSDRYPPLSLGFNFVLDAEQRRAAEALVTAI